jgi:hypothetical protein
MADPAPVFVILTSKPGQYRTEPAGGMSTLESYAYRFHGRLQAQFVIAALPGPAKLRVVEETVEGRVNLVPSKFFPRFDTLEAARRELNALVSFGRIQTSLERLA